MNKKFFIALLFLGSSISKAQNLKTVKSPDGNLEVSLTIDEGTLFYTVSYLKEKIMANAPLGIRTNEGNFDEGLSFVTSVSEKISNSYEQDKIKQSQITYTANSLKYTVSNSENKQLSVLFQVSDNDIAFRYEIPKWGETRAIVIENELTGFKFPENTTSFLSGMMHPMTGFARTAPSYESAYNADVPVSGQNASEGYIFPGLFKVEQRFWVLISETGVRSLYPGSHLSNYQEGVFYVDFPSPEQNNGFGSSKAQVGLPGITPWRTITVGEHLKPIVETTISWDVVEPLYEPSQNYEYGKGTWSWIIWQDASMNYEDQKTYIDLAAAMHFKYILIDAWWDERIGYERMKELIDYAASKEVGVFLWYNSNGIVNDAFQTPLNKMNTSIERKQEMQWLKKAGVKGLKVDFFGGDKQETMRLYEDILSDANDYGLMVIFHGTTLPRGWERIYPNFVGSEAVVASEMLVFVEDVRKKEAYNASIHPFVRNAVASMEFGGVVLNDYLNRGNKDGQKRMTTDAFQLATGVLFQNPVQMFALTPNNLDDAPQFELDFLKKLPTTWDETRFIDGYPGKFSVVARRRGDTWYVAGINAESEAKKLQLDLAFLSGKKVTLINDGQKGQTFTKALNIPKNGKSSITVQPGGGFVIVNN
ncbi:glycoside hydrolase family 97 protein [Leeuwenhoekiella marinoflava]|uniref:Glycosyl hydrolase family 97 n=2 Tax=Leeuwenhoekiella marinoflava TaxID=988 RepID=A0A4Q0PPB7_9FLAO|nr:glycoside hydrolase family 97 protein [Leeuwenhoekiella marinoflava]RXG32400.1 glycosyl hydrolase family 97 [Leeuwenhoekiella marinoflava]SHE73104.1 Glycosyl-hydrolase 97 C-terminal, oligomerisation [Leeuwenhoekiella marinoflava DSM 3653]